jgi:exodeoxyribonuclease VII large subunit
MPERGAPPSYPSDSVLGAPDNPGARAGSPTIIPVSLLVSSARLLLERQLGLLWIAGEISGFSRAASGHCYFNLKDREAQVRCVFFRSKAQFVDFTLADGLAVEVRATPSIFEARGEFQLNVDTMRLAGRGALYERFARLKARLEAAGWFAAARKRALPRYPRAVGIVTSTRAAALRDLLATLRWRWPPLRVIVYPAAVQGDAAPAAIAAALLTANARAEVDVLIVARGGGSIEDLWAFNEESVARAVFESALPVVSGVGHETDFTICDFVADVRAATPTAAATLVAPDRHALLRDVTGLYARWRRARQTSIEGRMQRIDHVSRLLVHPAARLARQSREMHVLGARLGRALRQRLAAEGGRCAALAHRLAWHTKQRLPQATRVERAAEALRRATAVDVERARARIAALAQNLAHLDPRAVLDRGYAIVTKQDGAIVQDAHSLAVGERVDVAFGRGDAEASIERIR